MPPSPSSHPESRSERTLFHGIGSSNLWASFRQSSCGHFSLKSKDEIGPTFHGILATFFTGVGENVRLHFALRAHGITILRDRKSTSKLFQHELFAPHPKRPVLGPQKKVCAPHFLGKNAKRDTH